MRTIRELYKETVTCEKCSLAESRGMVVFGRGNEKAPLLFVGEGPGEEEDREGKPFVGTSGKLLMRLFEKSGLEPEDYFITNVVCCRPTTVTEVGGRNRIENRKPNKEEIEACRPRLMEVIRIVDPVLIIALGDTALKALTKTTSRITEVRGQMFATTIPGIKEPLTYSVMAEFHPAFITRRPDYGTAGWMQKVCQDLIRCKAITMEVSKW